MNNKNSGPSPEQLEANQQAIDAALNYDPAFEAAERAFADRDPEQINQVVSRFHEFGQDGISHLESVATDSTKDPRHRTTAIRLLGKLNANSQSLIESLQSIAKAAEEEVATAATEVLVVLLIESGKTELEHGRPDQAMEHFELAIKSDSNSADARLLAAQVYFARDQYKQALSELDMAIALDDQNPEAFKLRSMVNHSTKRYEQAVKDISSCIELNENDPQAFELRAQFQMAVGNFDATISDASKVVAMGKKSQSVFIILGLAYAQKEEFKLAIESYTQAIELKPTPQLFRLRADAYRKAGEKELAAQDEEAAESTEIKK